MTAEIALLNRRALAFAADSAVTISDGNKNNKIYNSAEKIFELSWRSPIGLMLYNTMDFVGVPIDVLARIFRSEHDVVFPTIESSCSRFLGFLSDFKRTVEDEADHLEAILLREIKEILEESEDKNSSAIINAFKNNEGADVDINDVYRTVIIGILRDHAAAHEAQRLPGFLEDISVEQFDARYGYVIRNRIVLRDMLRWSDDAQVIDEIVKWSYNTLRSSIFSDYHTGFVFGGFGSEDIFPSLHAVEVDGIFFDQIKQRVRIAVDVDRRGERAAIVPFAQSEMVERFLFGIDDDLEQKIITFVEQSFDKICQKYSQQHDVDLYDIGLTGATYSKNVLGVLERLKEKSRRETLDMVDFMPKQELAYTAEAFVTLTSMKRKVSAQQETVGGPIDVAVITKNEGFVWIKRKHYFDRELNVGYGIRTEKIREGGGSNVGFKPQDRRNGKPKAHAKKARATPAPAAPKNGDK